MAWSDQRWILRHHAAPAPLPGWFLLDTRRHVQSAASFDREEAGEFATVLGAAMRAIARAARVPRVYVVMFGEGAPHLHAHLIPRDPGLVDSCAWKVADLYRAVEGGRHPAASDSQVSRIIDEVRVELGSFTAGSGSE